MLLAMGYGNVSCVTGYYLTTCPSSQTDLKTVNNPFSPKIVLPKCCCSSHLYKNHILKSDVRI